MTDSASDYIGWNLLPLLEVLVAFHTGKYTTLGGTERSGLYDVEKGGIETTPTPL